MSDLSVAVLADIHGNRWALEAVLEDIRRRGITDMVNLGDCLYGPLDPTGTAGMLLELDMPTVRGNEDRILLDDPGRHPDSPSLPFVQARLRPEHLRWLRALPLTTVFQEIFLLCHGTPESDHEYLAREVIATSCRLLSPAAIALKLARTAQPAVLFGHDHLPALLSLPDGRLLVNPGSVGLPAYRDDLPFPHAMEAGSHHARYSIVTRAQAGFAVEHVAVAYDWESAATVAESNGRPDWAIALRSGRVF
ncbi:MAG: metallophosphatase family protein [Acidobacteria bacterium]|jgi:diadenosine tetraphosphatase ApaH/serine/threonine PP2A family protein phosphatase|nr:metallophosphatase family protein [Acidobacteriota bacterium]